MKTNLEHMTDADLQNLIRELRADMDWLSYEKAEHAQYALDNALEEWSRR